MTIQQYLEIIIAKNASDLHLSVGYFPMYRINGELIPIPATTVLTLAEIETLVYPMLSEHQRKIYEENWELDWGLEYQDRARFRVNLYRQRGHLSAAFRLIPRKIKTIDELGLPHVLSKLTELKQGLVLMTGPTGHGKTTSLAAFINQINLTRKAHIITIEDPIEFTYPEARSLISQRELNTDTKSWSNALKSALREDPDVVLIGEMRDLETISAAMTIAETGHLVFATLHTNSASQSVDRIVDIFPVNQQPQIRTQLAAVTEAIISQRLIPTIVPGRALATEILFGTPALRAIIREGKTHLIDNLIQTSGELGMMNMETSLTMLVREGKITTQTALNYSLNPQVLNKLLGMG
jgi:twitching motility protein PilT